MIILVANLGSTSFKYRLYDLADRPTIGDEKELARGGVERIGAPESRVYARTGGQDIETVRPVPDHAVALRAALEQLTGSGGPLGSIDEVAAVGFKAVHGGRVSGVVRVTPTCWRRWRRCGRSPRPTIRRTSRRCGCWGRSCQTCPS